MRVTPIVLCAGLLAVAGCNSSLLPSGPGLGRPAGSGQLIPPHTAALARDGRDSAELDVVSGAATVSVSAARLGGDLLRASTPPDSGVRPALVAGQAVQVFLDGTGQGGPAALRIVLNAAVRWRLVFSGGASQTSVSMAGGRLSGADFTAGTSLLRLVLPDPGGSAVIVLAGGASELDLSLPAGVPARLRLDGGASAVTLNGRSYTGLAGGTVLTMPGWGDAASRYDIVAPAGVSAVLVTSRQPGAR
ncbi:MAG TPA: hypothetical protein VH637_10900 [Streptosporangiaceae bacterium]|jgi:hypothetical protein